MPDKKTPGASAIDTTNFARQIVLDFEFAPVPRQRQRRGLRNEIIEVGAVKLDNRGNVMGEFSQFVQTEYAEGVAYPVRELTGISAVDTAMADPLYMVIKRLGDWIGRYSAQVVCWSGADRRQLMTECQAKHIDLAAIPTDWADLQAFYTSIMDVGSHGCVSLGDAATWFGIDFDESTGHAHSALADARVTAKLLKQMMDGDYHVSPRAQEVRQRWGMGERAQTRLSKKCPELSDLLLKLQAEGGVAGRSFGDKQKEWLRERFQNQQQMAVFEMLFEDTLTLTETNQVKSVDIEKAYTIEERLANMIRWTDRQRPVTLCALSCTMRHTGCRRRAIPTRL